MSEVRIRHQEARRLIQLNLDGILNRSKQQVLSEHLGDCAECRAYAQELESVEGALTDVLWQKWNIVPLPLSISTIMEKTIQRKTASALLTMRNAMIGLTVVVFLFGVWQITFGFKQSPLNALPVPTPSTQSTSTIITTRDCPKIRYEVQEGDTLERIADQFLAKKETIMALNKMESETLHPSTEIIIPLCFSSPTSTNHPPTSTLTLTPRTSPTAHMPAGQTE